MTRRRPGKMVQGKMCYDEHNKQAMRKCLFLGASFPPPNYITKFFDPFCPPSKHSVLLRSHISHPSKHHLRQQESTTTPPSILLESTHAKFLLTHSSTPIKSIPCFALHVSSFGQLNPFPSANTTLYLLILSTGSF